MRGDRREEIFRDERVRWKFLVYLAEGAERYRVKVHSLAQAIGVASSVASQIIVMS
jgi:endonuclease V-like protein UPF0215 family